WHCWDSWLEEHQLSPLQATLRYALNQPLVERVVVGVDSAQQWQQILQAAAGNCPPVPAELGTTDPALLNPALWKTA
ncbi:MAG: aldo/keto reductase, partial [Pseudomonadota bacterium]|nr:aldo/keto reductase [Pseudomonadota bacterium]